ncbi:serine/threonine-protein kinase TBK1 isoform X2 [Venturia canescens]|nr:serine/threonine-protein kinase TBK1 isoform X2 [Venturia canescens]
MRPLDVQMREFQVLKKVKHENIVKLLAIEEEQDGRGKVIVMELCTGGSLFNILDDPENTYGLAEKEFLLVLRHLSAGMKHLRDNNLVHRDLKPGNIMKFVEEDGSTVYKLTDFGAARELHEDQQFVSLYGTEEYLHPDMYERAVLRKPVGKSFGATVDLWSIGVTLYHVATGNLPFRPFGGRRNKETMFYITTKKASGVISGTQLSENGPIEWSSDLPDNCRLSFGLKKIVTPLLAGLLEVDRQKIWSFDRFFSQVTDTLARRAIHIFHVHRAESIQVYLHPDEKLIAFQNYVQEQTDVASHAQILLYENVRLTDRHVDESTPGKGYPTTSLEEPLMLFSRENNNVTLKTDIISEEQSVFPVFANLVSVENDASQAKVACSVGHSCKRQIDKIALSSKLSDDAVRAFTTLVCNQLTRVLEKSNRAKELTRATENTASAIERSENLARDIIEKYGDDDARGKLELNKHWRRELESRSKQLSSELAPAINQLHQRYVKEANLSSEWESGIRQSNCPWKSKAGPRAATLIDRLRDGWQHLLRDRATRSLTYNDEQFHVLERIKVTETGRRMKALLESECIPSITQRSECLADWYKMAQTVYLQTQILDKDTSNYQRSLDTYAYRLSQESTDRHEALSRLIKRLPEKQIGAHTCTLSGCIQQQEEGTKKWQNICDTQEQIALILAGNDSLVKQLLRLSMQNEKFDESNDDDNEENDDEGADDPVEEYHI